MSISAPDPAPLLEVAALSAWYGEARALTDVSFSIRPGEVMCIIGANGAGKSTLLRGIAGLMNRGAAAHLAGGIDLRGRRIEGWEPARIVDAGVALVPEGRRLFARMSVEDNLLCGAYIPRARPGMAERLAGIYRLFPRLAERRTQTVSQMSGGEQQMVALGRALMSAPSLLLIDELSLGLAPIVIEDIYRRVRQINAQGTTCVIVEQDMRRALATAQHVLVMRDGRVVLEGTPATLSETAITAAYFGSKPPSASP